jgi:hypothetical protein
MLVSYTSIPRVVVGKRIRGLLLYLRTLKIFLAPRSDIIYAHAQPRAIALKRRYMRVVYVCACGEHSCQAVKHQRHSATPAGPSVFCLHRRHTFKGGKPIVILHVRKEPPTVYTYLLFFVRIVYIYTYDDHINHYFSLFLCVVSFFFPCSFSYRTHNNRILFS